MIDNQRGTWTAFAILAKFLVFLLKFWTLDIFMNFLDVLVKYLDIYAFLLGFSQEKDIAQIEAMPKINHFFTKSRSLMS